MNSPSIPLSVTAVAQSPAPDTSFLFDTSRTWILGVLNATPDSFYAGSRVGPTAAALGLADRMLQEGASALDIGGESTRPGAEEVPTDVELERVLPLLDALLARWPSLAISVDTQKAGVARRALAQGASVINDVSALRCDPAMAGVVAEAQCPVILMHSQGTPRTMQDRPAYTNVVDDVKRFFAERLAFAVRHGIKEERVILDPGIGFGKAMEHNLSLLKQVSEFMTFGRPLLVGVSRKSFIGRCLGGEKSPLPPEERLEGSLAAALWAVGQGARGLRVHDVGATRRAVQIWDDIQQAS